MAGRLDRTTVLRALLGASLLLACSGCYTRALDTDEIRELLSDSIVTGRHEVHHYTFRRHYRPDGTFVQDPTGAYPRRTGRWSVHGGGEVCIAWDMEGRQLCRTIFTDDQGAYWKELERKSKLIITYRTFEDVEGRDRRRIKTPSARVLYWLFSWRGLLAIIGTLIVARIVLGSGGDPSSRINAIRRRWFQLSAGERSYWYHELPDLSPRQLDAFADACAANDKWVELFWVREAFQAQEGALGRTLERLWRAVQPLSDRRALTALAVALDLESSRGVRPSKVLVSDGPALEALGDDPRFCYLMGRVFRDRADKAPLSTVFDANKARALAFLGSVREREPDPDATTDYVKLAAESYEKVMYANFRPPGSGRRGSRGRSTSYAGGG